MLYFVEKNTTFIKTGREWLFYLHKIWGYWLILLLGITFMYVISLIPIKDRSALIKKTWVSQANSKYSSLPEFMYLTAFFLFRFCAGILITLICMKELINVRKWEDTLWPTDKDTLSFNMGHDTCTTWHPRKNTTLLLSYLWGKRSNVL